MAIANGYANILRAYRTLAMQRVTLSSKVLVYEHQNWKIPSYRCQYWGVHWCDVKICHILLKVAPGSSCSRVYGRQITVQNLKPKHRQIT